MECGSGSGRQRLYKRESLHYYNSEPGNVLYFHRQVTLGETALEAFDGLAPSLAYIPSGQLVPGLEYTVQGPDPVGTLTHNGVTYGLGDTFTAVNPDYTCDEDARPYQYDGIVPATPGRLDNRWLLFLSFTADFGQDYSVEDGDILGMLNHRGTAFEPGPEGWDLHNLQRNMAPSGFTYYQQINKTDEPRFYQSCQVYPADYQVVSVRSEDENGDYSESIVRVELDRPLASSPESNELKFRSDDNAVREYIEGPEGVLPGDCGAHAEDPPNVGAIYPRFYFTRLCPLAYSDVPEEDAVQQPADTRCLGLELQWMRLVLEAICEGYVDTRVPPGARLIHYTFPTLCHHALGNRWLSLDKFGRDDNAQSFGPLPNTKLAREDINDLSACLNLLDTLPVEIPLHLQYRYKLSSGRVALTPDYVDDDHSYPDNIAHTSEADDYVYTGIPIGNDLVALFDPDADTVTLNPDYGSFSAGDPVAFNPLGSSALPSPLEADTTYYVVWVDPEYPHVAKLASTPGGDPIDLTESGDLLDGIECYYPEEWSDWSDGPIEAELDAADSIANTRGDGNHRTGLELLSWEAGGNPESDLPQDAQGHYFLTAARRLVQVRHNANHNGFTCLPEHVLDLLDANARLYLQRQRDLYWNTNDNPEYNPIAPFHLLEHTSQTLEWLALPFPAITTVLDLEPAALPASYLLSMSYYQGHESYGPRSTAAIPAWGLLALKLALA